MSQEIEVKYRLDDPPALRARLRACGARRVGAVLELNRMFDTIDRRLLATGCGLRLRTCRPLGGAGSVSELERGRAARSRAPGEESPRVGRPGDCAPGSDPSRHSESGRREIATLTYKGPRGGGPAKRREELETTVGDPEAAATFLQRLGFQETIVYEKRRETWRRDDCEICLDELPELGWFVEIEGPNAEALESLSRRLALSGQVPLAQTYVEMAAVQGDAGAQGVRRLRFRSSTASAVRAAAAEGSDRARTDRTHRIS